MMTPLLLLAAGAIGAGFIPFGNYVSSDGHPLASELHITFSIAPVTIGLAGILLAYLLYKKENTTPAAISQKLGGIYQAAYHKFYIDELYLFVTKKILFNAIGQPLAWFDRNVVDGLINAIGNGTTQLSESIKKIQSGKLQHYALVFLAGLFLLFILIAYVWQ